VVLALFRSQLQEFRDKKMKFRDKNTAIHATFLSIDPPLLRIFFSSTHNFEFSQNKI
jgi:hypothetical protein